MVEYVKVCPAFDPGFFYIPGSDTCLKIGGYAWTEVNYAQAFTRASNTLGTRTALAVTLDARQNTEFGLLRTVVTPRIDYRMGTENSGSAQRTGLSFNSGSTEPAGGSGKQTQFNAVGYVQLGGFTAGHMGSFFNQVSPNTNIGLDGFDQRDLINTIAYTASLGNGITVTGALEDGTIQNRDGVYSSGNNITYGNNKLPDYIGVLTADQAWGKIALSGALHTINTSSAVVGTEYGYAAQLGTKLNLPMLSNGSYLFLNGIYTNGANAFSLRNVAGDVNSQSTSTMGIGRVAVGMNDIVVDANNSVHKATVWGGAAEFGYQVTPTVLTFLGGSYTKLDWDTTAQAVNAAINPANIMRVNLGLQWTPIKGFRVFPDVEWSKISVKTATNAGAPTEGAAKKNESAWTARIQVRRDF